MSTPNEHRVVADEAGSPFHPYSLENEIYLTRFFPDGFWEVCTCPLVIPD